MSLLVLIAPELALANGLRVGVRVKTELYSSILLVTHDLNTCFSTDKNGVPVIGLCTTGAREPASGSTNKPVKPPRKPGSKIRVLPDGTIESE